MATQNRRPARSAREAVRAALIIPAGWGASLKNGDPIPLPLYLDGSDTNTASELEGRIQESLGQISEEAARDMIDDLPEEVVDMAKKLPVEVRKEFVSAMSQWGLETKVLYNPEQRFIEYVVPGVIGIILQLLTVTLTACTIARERESGTLYQLMVTSLRRSEIVIGKILPYLAISILLILVIIVVAGWHFHVQFHQHPMLALICLLFLLCSLGLGLLISAFSRTQTQAIQLSVFFLLPIFVLSGAFAPLEQLPPRDPLSLGILSAHPFLPRLPAGQSLSGGAGLLQQRSHLSVRRSDRDFRRRGTIAQTHPAVTQISSAPVLNLGAEGFDRVERFPGHLFARDITIDPAQITAERRRDEADLPD